MATNNHNMDWDSKINENNMAGVLANPKVNMNFIGPPPFFKIPLSQLRKNEKHKTTWLQYTTASGTIKFKLQLN